MSDLQSVVISKKVDGSWQALHVPSGKVSHGESKDEAETAMRDLLGMDDDGGFGEPLTSERFSGMAKDIALFLEGPVSEMLSLHSGFARLEAYEAAIAHIRLGGGCQGCPSSTMTLVSGVQQQLIEKFGDENILDIVPVN
jgi:Fe-S cluster biogenesis protein NfuA